MVACVLIESGDEFSDQADDPDVLRLWALPINSDVSARGGVAGRYWYGVRGISGTEARQRQFRCSSRAREHYLTLAEREGYGAGDGIRLGDQLRGLVYSRK